MAEFWFDTRDGALLVGEAAAAPRLEEAGPDVVPLPDLLKEQEFPFTRESFDKLEVATWESSDYVTYGKWVLELLRAREEHVSLRGHSLKRMYILGLGPEPERIDRRFGPISNYKKEVGSPLHYDRVQYADWAITDFVDYAARVQSKLHRLPNIDDYQRMFKRGQGPSLSLIEDRVGGIKELHDYLGFPNTRYWGKEDFAIWGAKIMEANHGMELTPLVAMLLSKKRRCPSTWTIAHKMGSWSAFKTAATEEYNVRQVARAQKLSRYHSMIGDGQLPSQFESLEEDELMATAAKYLIARRCAPIAADERWCNVAEESSGSFLTHVRRLNRAVTAGYIETEAVLLDVFDDIWPIDDYKNYLRISPELLEQAKAQYAEKKRLSRSK